MLSPRANFSTWLHQTSKSVRGEIARLDEENETGFIDTRMRTKYAESMPPVFSKGKPNRLKPTL